MFDLNDLLSDKIIATDSDNVLVKTVIDIAPDITDIFGRFNNAEIISHIAKVIRANVTDPDPEMVTIELADPAKLDKLRVALYPLAITNTVRDCRSDVDDIYKNMASLGDKLDNLKNQQPVPQAPNGHTSGSISWLLILLIFSTIIFCISIVAFGDVKVDTAIGGAIIAIAGNMAGKIGTVVDYIWGGSNVTAKK